MRGLTAATGLVLTSALLGAALSAAFTPGGEPPAAVEAFVARHWRRPVLAQGAPPAHFSPLEASLRPEACGSCHASQYADWRGSPHAAAMGPGVAGQLVELQERDPAAALGCHDCHAPLAEQRPLVAGAAGLEKNPTFDPALRAAGLPCAGCHVRGHRRYGPPPRAGRVEAAPGTTLPHDGVTRSPAFLRSEFCRDCHQFAPDGPALNGKLLENTYEEWRASPSARDGVQCQDCHMPDRRHLWRGIHDAEMVASGLTIILETPDEDGAPVGILRVTSSGVGHAFPTYVTPRVVLRAELIDGAGAVVAGSRLETVIARDVTLDLSAEVFDTRLRPGESATLEYRPPASRPGLRARFSVVVYPDWFYTRFFQALLAQGAGRGEAQIREALAATRRSVFTLFEQEAALR